MVKLYPHQIEAVEKLKSGSILCGGVGTGKSLTALEFYKQNFIDRHLIIITTAKKRDSFEWQKECNKIGISNVRIDSWNNIKKYKKETQCFFIFDEQRLIGSGTWVKSFLNIARKNKWLLLTATPGDTWTDYIPVFIANKFYKNRTEFLSRHAVYNRFTKYPQIDRFLETSHLLKLKRKVVVDMWYDKQTNPIVTNVVCEYNKRGFDMALKKRWDPFKNQPIQNIAGLCYILRKMVNINYTRVEALHKIYKQHKKLIVFYNFDYERDILLEYAKNKKIKINQWNGHVHDELPTGSKWLYIVQYTAGAEGWNCTDTNTIVFYSKNYSYRSVVQAAGRIDRINTLYKDLYYYHLTSDSAIDKAIQKAYDKKRNFNERSFASQKKHRL